MGALLLEAPFRYPPWERRRSPLLLAAAGPNGRIYILGTVPIAPEEIHLVDEHVFRTARSADRVMVETHSGGWHQALRNRMSYPETDELSRHCAPEVLQSLYPVLRRRNIPDSAVRRIKPWALAMLVSGLALEESGVSPDEPFETLFLDRIGRRQAESLMTHAEWIDRLDQLTGEQQAQCLEEAIRLSDRVPDAIRSLRRAWRRGREDQMEESLARLLPETPGGDTLRQVLLAETNRLVADRLATRLENGGTSFVLLNVVRLFGAQSVPSLLAEKGIEMVPVDNPGSGAVTD
jgi:uncharacterized protein YbaP (TraB family)